MIENAPPIVFYLILRMEKKFPLQNKVMLVAQVIYGLHMGNFRRSDSNDWSHFTDGTYYPYIGIPARFTVETYEVFQVIKQ